MRFTKKDLFFSIITGLLTGFVAWRVFEFIGVPEFQGISYFWLLVLIPILWILGINLGYFLGKWISFFSQFGKFAAIGFTNAAVDFGILNLLIFYSGIASGVYFSVFKTSSFIGAAIHSYFWNKFWVFDAGRSGVSGQEFFKFFSISVMAALVNVAIASVIVNVFGPQFGINPEGWANVGAVVGSAIALVVSFVGFRTLVFKK